METWSAHHLYSTARESLGTPIANDLVRYADNLRSEKLPVVFSLRHLAELIGVRYWFLHETVNRMRESSNYRMYAIRKRSGGRRFIHSVSSELHKVQSWINQNILQRCEPHPCSYAFHRNGGIRACAAAHCGARWLFQFDLKDFFYDVSEIDCYRVFKHLGYRKLLSFELARICTTKRLPKWCPRAQHHGCGDIWYYDDYTHRWEVFACDVPRDLPYVERFGRMGALPQGAPTSPMLSNLAAIALDEMLHAFAREHGMVYTRYADDLTLSASELELSRKEVRRRVKGIIRKTGFAENELKSRIAGPGSRKLVLGLLVDGDQPRISKATYNSVDRMLHGVERFGFESTASHFQFESSYGFHNHLSGLIAFVKSVDERRFVEFADRMANAKSKWQAAK